MKRALVLTVMLVCCFCIANADEIYFSGSSIYGPASVSPGTTTTGSGFCWGGFASCSGGFSISVTTAAGSLLIYNTGGDESSFYRSLSGTYGPGGSINVSFNDGSTLSGYLLGANFGGYDVSQYGQLATWEYDLSGAFVATALTGPMWDGVDKEHVGGTFNLGTHFPHSPGVLGLADLEVVQTPEPSTFLLLGAAASTLLIYRVRLLN
jgi:hypothetical protein